jgi:multiple sugar transport system permease protein
MISLAGRRRSGSLSGVLLTGLTYLLLFVFLVPTLWVIGTSVRPEIEIAASPAIWIPQQLTAAHYQGLFGVGGEGQGSRVTFPQYFTNSAVVALTTTLISVLVGALAGYGFSRFRFRGKSGLFLLMLFVRALPGLAIALPLFILYRTLDLQDTKQGLVIIYAALAIPTVAWLMEGFFAELPYEIEEAARIDGCSRWQVFWRIALPLAAPGLAATAVIVFLWSWDEFGLALVLTGSLNARTLSVGLYEFVQEFRVAWGQLTAAGTLMLLPVIVFTVTTQRFLVRGLTFGAVK